MQAIYSNEIEFRRSQPAVEIRYGAVYMPTTDVVMWELDPTWGLYDEDGILIDAAAYYRGAGKNLVGQSERIAVPKGDLEVAPPERYIYGGNLIFHFGHFLLSSLSRFWIGTRLNLRDYIFVCHGAGNPDGWWSHGYVRDIFQAVGLTRENFVTFRRPTRIPEIMVPRPAAEEHNFVHQIYAEWCHIVGRGLWQNDNLPTDDTPVWLSKTKLTSGVQGLRNEDELVDHLARHGMEIAHPQELSVKEQVGFYATRRSVAGMVGSALHTSVLWPPRTRMIGVEVNDTIVSNYAITDRANRNRVQYLHASRRAVAIPPTATRVATSTNSA